MGRALVALCAVALWAPAAAAEQLRATGPYVIDGDTLVVNRQRVRLQNVDAPELSEPGGAAARDYLRRLVLDKPVVCESQARDRYKRLVATCSVATAVDPAGKPTGFRDLGAALIAAGLGKPHVRPINRGKSP